MVKFGGKIGTLYQMLKNTFKKHPLQNRTNVQIKGGGVKGLLNNVQKNCTFLIRWLPLLDYLLRHPGNPAMRSRSHDLHWTQSMMLDVGLFFFLLGLLVLVIVYSIVCRCCFSSKRKEKSE